MGISLFYSTTPSTPVSSCEGATSRSPKSFGTWSRTYPRSTTPVPMRWDRSLTYFSPISSGCIWIFQGLQMLSDFHHIDVPVPLPSGDYLLLLDWIFDFKPQFATNVYFTFVEGMWKVPIWKRFVIKLFSDICECLDGPKVTSPLGKYHPKFY